MSASVATVRTARVDAVELVLRGTAFALALVAARIHASLGSLLYTLNAIGFTVLAAGLIVPFGAVVGPQAGRALRTLVRIGLLGFALSTIVGWILFGARYSLGYEATAVETAIVVVTVGSILRATGGPVSVARELLSLVPSALRRAA
jgi:hypothetical protein